MPGLLMLAALDLASHFGYVLRPHRRSGGNRASREQEGSGVQALPRAIPCGDIKFRQSLVVVFVIFHGIPQELSLEPVYRRPDRVKKSIRESALFDMGTFDTKIPRSELVPAKAFCNTQAVP